MNDKEDYWRKKVLIYNNLLHELDKKLEGSSPVDLRGIKRLQTQARNVRASRNRALQQLLKLTEV